MTLPNTAFQVNPEPQQLPLFSEINYYHDTSRRGFFSILASRGAGAKQQRSYRLDLLPEIIKLLDRKNDAYISQAEFIKPNRRVVNLARIGLAFVDLDYYSCPDLRDLAPDQIAGQVLGHAHDNGIPLPSVIVSSGRGLYLKWFLDSTIPRQALPRWNALQRSLVDSFAHFGADQRAKDASRVLRLESTVNSKTGDLVRIIYPTTTPILYDFEQLCRDALPLDRHEIRQQQQNRPRLQVIQGSGKPSGLRPLSAIRLNWDRLEDLRRLASLRGGVEVGQRDTFLFLSTCFAAWTIAPGQLYREAEALAREFAPAYSRAQIHSYTSSAVGRATEAAAGRLLNWDGLQIDPRYRFKNSTLIDWLQITGDEERQLKTIISTGEAMERDRLRHRRAADGGTDRLTYLSQAEDKRITARLMRAQGATINQIAAELGIKRENVYRLF